MSYRMEEPEWDAICECVYDPLSDRMNRENCFFHSDLEDEMEAPVELGEQSLGTSGELSARQIAEYPSGPSSEIPSNAILPKTIRQLRHPKEDVA